MSDDDKNSSLEISEKHNILEKTPDAINTDENLKSEEKPVESTLNTTTSEDSEYETLEEDDGESSRSSRSRQSSFSEHLSDGIVIEDEREDGDGQEENSSTKDKKLDDDEDRRNPQYIPKKGTFYEHDDRTMTDENEEESNENDTSKKEKSDEGEKDTKPSGKKGKIWTEKPERERWTHDLYNEDEQGPKSTQELIDTYGYDIRNEEAPPKARRRRRYGRGPNKYTRNWEDEDAYIRAVPAQRRVFRNNKEEFPEIGETKSGNRGERDNGPARHKSKSPARVQKSPPQHQSRTTNERDRERYPRREQQREWGPRKEVERQGDFNRREKLEKPLDREHEKPKPFPIRDLNLPEIPKLEKPIEKKPFPGNNNFPSPPLSGFKEAEAPKVGRGRGFRGTGKARPMMEFTATKGRTALPSAFNNREPSSSSQEVPETLKHAADILVQDFRHIYINNNSSVINTDNIVEETIIPRSERRSQNHSSGDGQHNNEGNVSGRSKRYSTQRQRSLPETTPPPTYSPPHNIPYYTQPPPPSYVPAPVYNEVAPPPVTSPPMQIPISVAFLPPGPPPAPTAAPPYPPPPLLNYMPPPTYPTIALQPQDSLNYNSFFDENQVTEEFLLQKLQYELFLSISEASCT